MLLVVTHDRIRCCSPWLRDMSNQSLAKESSWSSCYCINQCCYMLKIDWSDFKCSVLVSFTCYVKNYQSYMLTINIKIFYVTAIILVSLSLIVYCMCMNVMMVIIHYYRKKLWQNRLHKEFKMMEHERRREASRGCFLTGDDDNPSTSPHYPYWTSESFFFLIFLYNLCNIGHEFCILFSLSMYIWWFHGYSLTPPHINKWLLFQWLIPSSSYKLKKLLIYVAIHDILAQCH